jgi:hypothetical protein
VDLALYMRVLWRFRLVVAVGLLATLAAALLATVRIDPNGFSAPTVTYRQKEVWRSEVVHLLTQEGFPWGRTIYDEAVPLGDVPSAGYTPRFGEPERFMSLAALYSHLAVSDNVVAIVRAGGPMRGRFGAEAVRTPDGSSSLPLLRIVALASSSADAVNLAKRASRAFRLYLNRIQASNDVEDAERVKVEVIAALPKATLESGRSLVLPLLAVVLGVFLTVGVVFTLENLRPHLRVASPMPEESSPKLVVGHARRH